MEKVAALRCGVAVHIGDAFSFGASLTLLTCFRVLATCDPLHLSIPHERATGDVSSYFSCCLVLLYVHVLSVRICQHPRPHL